MAILRSSVRELIAQHYSREEEIPDYQAEEAGCENLNGVLERVRMEHYPTLIEKVGYFFIQINKGHFFSNGNKRLALVCAIGLLIFNDKEVNHDLTKNDYERILLDIFPNCAECLEDHADFNSAEFALYNLSIIVADSHKYVPEENGFDMLKNKVTQFFNRSVVDSH